MFFAKKTVDTRSRQAMIGFLTGHFRYDTMNSCNRSTSYANCIKLHRLGLTNEQLTAAYDVLNTDYWDQIDGPISEFTRQMNGQYTIGSNGRSSGYLVLYHSRYEDTGYKSHCRSCGQRNYKRVAPKLEEGSNEAVIAAEILGSGGAWVDQTYLSQSSIRALAISDEEKLQIVRRLKPELKDATQGNRCGRCGAEGEHGRVNYDKAPVSLSVYPGREMDQGEDFADWSIEQLRDRVALVRAFDKACDEMRDNFIDLITSCEVAEETIMVPKTVHVLRPRAE